MRHILLCSASALMFLGGQAAAQSADGAASASTAGAPDAQAAGQLGDIIVTAQRREESMQRAAVAVNVARGSDLINAGITEPYRLSELAPGLTIQPTSAGNLIFMRGVGNVTTTPNSDPAIAFNYDGVYIARPTATNGLFFDLDRVEVLKGPQGTLYGRNATGGAINVIPAQPRAGELSGYFTGSYGNYNTRTLEGAVNLPMGDTGALRVSGAIARHDGYLRDGTYDNDTASLRVQVKSELTPDLTVRVAADFEHVGGTSFAPTLMGSYKSTTSGNTFIPSGLSLDAGSFTPEATAYRTSLIAGTAARHYNATVPYPNHDDRFYGANAQIDWRTGAGTLTIIPAWRYGALDSSSDGGGIFYYRTREKDEQFSLEARFTGNRLGIFDYVLGAYYFHEDIASRITVNVQSAASFPGPNDYKTESFAPFARLTANLTDRLRVVGGLRYTRDNKSFVGTTTSFQIICVAAGCPTVPLLPTVDYYTDYPFPYPTTAGTIPYAPGALLARGATRNDNSRLTNDRVTYHGGIEFDAGPRSLLYATVESGYRAGGFNPATGFETYKPEFITAYTIGSKNRFLGDRLQLNIEGYWWEYSNQQISHVGVDLSGRAANFTQNVGKSRIKGVEVEAHALVTRNTLVSADVQYLDAHYLSFSYPQLATGTTPLNGCSNTTSGTLVTTDCSGRPALNSPKWTINLAGQQTIPLGDYKLVAGVDTQHQSSRYVGFEYLPQELVGPTWTTNAQLTFSPLNDRWSISGFVRNIEDNRIYLSTTIVPTTTILAVGTSAPRTYGVRASVKF
ncbi:TonB-dependent receptor [Sphingomonas sp. CL5.1]|uniref:TonB-dependent receptor n=1 Tax=Sphingomonas sp. CL5.1 TaxID=2653203 RepID=UPI0015835666|nr:TonB-dependent receptor [Sphingomonas sp. CL5.1]QKR99793.1 TonB-dependent receptor [Sphingomonas sp. CL5.1]